ncbi:MAG: hypothetical protein ACE5IJ_08035 [Thermoplasmata archaeon]
MKTLRRSDGDWLSGYQAAKVEVMSRVPTQLKDVKIVHVPHYAVGANFVGRWVVVLDSLCFFPDEAILGVLAHELAHIHLKENPQEMRDDEDSHLAADRIARDWGFGRDIRAYLRRYEEIREDLGWPALDRRRLEIAGVTSP